MYEKHNIIVVRSTKSFGRIAVIITPVSGRYPNVFASNGAAPRDRGICIPLCVGYNNRVLLLLLLLLSLSYDRCTYRCPLPRSWYFHVIALLNPYNGHAASIGFLFNYFRFHRKNMHLNVENMCYVYRTRVQRISDFHKIITRV